MDMKMLKNLKVKEIECGEYSEISKIIFENGIEAIAEEDTGGEYAYMIIDGYELKVGDVISFPHELDEYDCICNLEWIDVYDAVDDDFGSYRAWIESEGGNDCTCLSFNNVNLV